MQIPDYQLFEQAARSGKNLIGIGTALLRDQETVVSLADRFVDEDSFFLFESASSGPGQVARYSWLGMDPIWTWNCREEQVHINKSSKDEQSYSLKTVDKNPIKALEADMRWVRWQSLVDFHGLDDLAAENGAFGFFGYDITNQLEPSVGQAPKRELDLPGGHFFIPGTMMAFDQLSQKLHVYRFISIKDLPEDDWHRAWEQGVEALRLMVTKLQSTHTPPPLKISERPLDLNAFSNSIEKKDFLKKAETCLEYVRSGDVFQMQIGNRIQARCEARPFDLFRHLRTLNPSPYMFFYRFEGHHILGASPEMMVQVQEGKVTHRPIAGTRKRTWNAKKDEQMRAELTSSEKERAEHVMLVDLARNDVGRIAAPGSVEVDELMVVEQYSHVFHMVSQVTGKLANNATPADALIAGFPNGTVSGAPKIRAMQLIYEMEPVAREFYAGSMGVFNFAGGLQSTILIRTLHIKDKVASTQASAGIVYDSKPEEEWLETRNKLAACATVIQNTLPCVSLTST